VITFFKVTETITNKYQEAQQELICNVKKNGDDDDNEEPMEIEEAEAQIMEVDEVVPDNSIINESSMIQGDSMVKFPDCLLTQAVCAASCIFFQVILESCAQKYFFKTN